MRVVGVDVGGTFTDLVEVDEATGAHRYHKLPSTPDDPARAFLSGIATLTAGQVPDRTVHGSTVATNTLIQRSGARVGLITTEGYRDVLEIARGVKPYEHIFDLLWAKPEPLVPRYLRLGVRERLDRDGRVVVPLAEDEVALACAFLAEHEAEAVAICFLFSYLNDAHERRAAELVAQHLPGVPVSTSSSLLPQWREYERTATTVADAHVKPTMASYLGRLRDGLTGLGAASELLIMKSNGGVMTAQTATQQPIETYLSGPAAGVVSGQAIGQAAGAANVIVTDMGGTSFDISLVSNGEAATTTEAEAGEGIPVRIPMLDVRAIGAGGGSIAWIDEGGGLRVGPRSAGAVPGPACYGLGGVDPTVTDANLALGRLSAEAFLGGEMRLDPAAAHAAIEGGVASPLGLEPLEAALGIVDVCVANAAREIRSLTAARGIDPRDYALVAGGGAGPLHAAQIARELSIPTVLVPPFPGVLSAIGLVLADLKFDSVRSLPVRLERDGTERIASYLDEMVAEGIARVRAERVGGEPLVALSLDMRYQGQNWEIEIPIERNRLDVATVAATFDAEHERLYRFQMPEHEHEVINLRVSATGRLPRTAAGPLGPPRAAARGAGAPPRERPVVDDLLRREVPAAVLHRDELRPGHRVSGPAIVEAMDTTVYVPSDWRSTAHENGILVLERADEGGG